MLDEKDLKLIGGLLDERFLKVDEKFLKLDEKLLTMEDRIVDKIVGDVGEVLEQNFLPMVGELIDERLDERLSPIERRLTTIETTMVTKTYLDDKMAGLKSDLVANDRLLEKRTDVLVDALAKRRALTPTDLERLEQARLFPRRTQQ